MLKALQAAGALSLHAQQRFPAERNGAKTEARPGRYPFSIIDVREIDSTTPIWASSITKEVPP